MPTPFTILNKTEDGKVNGTSIMKFFDGLKPGRYELAAKRLNKRSNQANRYYWGYLIVEAQRGFRDIGHDLSKEEVHEFFKSRFNYQEIVNEQTGEIISLPRSTANLPKDEFSEYIGKIQQFCAEWLNVVILDPNQQTALWE
jgi:hypothetical protein